MHFNIEYDHGKILEGYLIPDDFSENPVVRITLDDGSVLERPCDQMRKHVQDAGRHGTGWVGFKLDKQIIPDLENQAGLTIHDAKTGILVYRRPGPEHVRNMKLFRLELRMIPSLKFDKQCALYFQYTMAAAEQYGNETTKQAFRLNAVDSIYISGRLRLRGYELFLDKGFKFVCSIPEPYYEMASRLFILKRLSRGPVTFISNRDEILLHTAAQYFAETNLEDENEVKRALKKADSKVRNVLVSPIMRQLVCVDTEQLVSSRDISSALDAVSRFTTVGYDNDRGHFNQTMAEMLDISADELPITPRYAFIEDLAGKLRHMQIAESMLEEDLIFDHFVRQAVTMESANPTEASS